MKKHETLYTPEKKKEPLLLSEKQKNNIRNITLGIEEVDETIRSMAVEDVIKTLENNHPLNRVITDEEGNAIGYIACEDFTPREAYIKYLGTTKQIGRNLMQEIPAFIEYAKQQGYTKLNFHGWNDRLNRILERYDFKHIRTDNMADFSGGLRQGEALTQDFQTLLLLTCGIKYATLLQLNTSFKNKVFRDYLSVNFRNFTIFEIY